MNNKRLKTTHDSPIVNDSGISLSLEEPSANLQDLPNDVLKYCFSFIPGSYITVAPVCRQFYSNYCTMCMGESDTFNSADALFQITRNKRTTADMVSDDVQLFEHFIINDVPKEFIYKVCNKAAIKRHRDVIECAVAFGVEHGEEDKLFRLDDKVLETLGREGDLDMLKFLFSKLEFSKRDINGEYNLGHEGWEAIMLGAAKTGHVNILDWIYDLKDNCTTALFFEGSEENSAENIIRKICGMGNYESLMWCQEKWAYLSFEWYSFEVASSGNPKLFECLYNNSDESMFGTFEGAVQSGSIEMLEYCHQKQYPFREHTCARSLCNTDKDQALKVLKWLRQHEYPWNEDTCSSAAKYDNLKALKWARSEGCPWNEDTFAGAAENGNIEILEYCLDNGCPMDARACMMAVRKKNDDLKALEVLKWLRRHSCPWDQMTYRNALYSENYFCFLFALENGCPRGNVSPWRLMRIIMGSEDITVFGRFLQGYKKLFVSDFDFDLNLDFIFNSSTPDSVITEKLILLQKYGYEWTANFCRMATEFGNLKLLQWLKYHGCPWDVETCNSAVKGRNLEALKYAHKNGCEWNKHTFAYCMEIFGLKYEVDEIPTEPGWRMKEIYDYLVENDCPRPETSDWKIKSFESSASSDDDDSDDHFDYNSDYNSDDNEF